MKTVVLALAAASLFAAGSASAADRLTDVAYLKAARCDGMARGLPGVIDVQAMDALYKKAGSQRPSIVMERADAEFDRGARDAKSGDRKERNTAELTGVCSALLSDPSSVAKR